MAGPSAVPRRQFGGSHAGNVSQTHRDITDERYRDLRKPRRVRFFCNGDRYFKGKKLFITPHRYLSFNDLLNDLTGKLPASVHLPYGVRTIYSPVGGSKIRNIESLQDGQNYVVAGFENFRSIKYGKNEISPWSHENQKPPVVKQGTAGRPPNNDYYASEFDNNALGKGGYGAFQPGRPIRQVFPNTRRATGSLGPRTWTNKSNETTMKPRVITVVRHSQDSPRTNVKILLNRRTAQSYEQMMKDISDAFGPKWKNNRVKKLVTLKGKEVLGVNEFFRDDEVFIAVGNEPLTSADIAEVVQEVYADHPNAKNLIRDLEKKKRRAALVRARERDDSKDDATTGSSKRDSGFGSDTSIRDDGDLYYDASAMSRVKRYELEGREGQARIERERQRIGEQERERARRKKSRRLEAEQRNIEEEKRRKGLLPLRPIQEKDSFRKIQEEREREQRRKEAEKRLRDAEERVRREQTRRKKEAPQVIVVVKEDARKKLKKTQSSEDGYETDDDASHLSPHKPRMSPIRSNDSALDQYDSEEEQKEKERRLREEEESAAREQRDRERQEREEQERKEHERKEQEEEEERRERERQEELKERERKEREEKEKREAEERAENERKLKEAAEAKKRKRKQGGKTKMERQISNIEHVLEKYTPGKVLGDGNFAIVKQCKMNEGRGSEYAMKIIDKAKLKGKEHMIENEIEIMRLCDQPNIVKLIDEFETQDEIYLIMELVKGGDLFDAITQSVKFKEHVASLMVSDLSNALFYLHSRCIVHRDLKPENLLVCRNRDGTITLKLTDFGLAMEVVEPIYTVCGTPTYVAPEILSEIGYGLEVDMWAIGVITYILLCGFPPFRSPDRNQTELFEFIKAGEFEFLSPYWDSISKDAKDLIMHLLVVNKAKRFTAIDTLCHPWVFSQAGSHVPPGKTEDFRRNLRRDLEIQGKANRESFLNRRS